MPRKGTPRKPGVPSRYAEGGVIEKLLENPRLTQKQQRFAELLAAGVPYGQAATQAGYKSKASSYYALKHPLVQQYLQSIRAESRAIATYDLVMAMEEAAFARSFAIEHENPMAVVKATELRAKLSGLLIDRVEVATVDLRGALQRAETRVLTVLASPAQAAVLEETTSTNTP